MVGGNIITVLTNILRMDNITVVDLKYDQT
jgi:hypothetical protein